MTLKSSALNPSYFRSEALRRLLKYAMGLVTPLKTCVKTALMPPGFSSDPTEASQNIWYGNAGSANAMTGLSSIMFLSVSQASKAS